MSARHSNISIFVPHIGCPNQCSFCNQKHITGSSSKPNEIDVINAVNVAINSKNYNPETTEIAFFGGSFTAIDRDYMRLLLNAAYKFVENKAVKGIRISTRPDAINDEVLSILKNYGVTSIELGAQSLNDDVLTANKRGHTVSDVYNASKLIKKYGFSLGLQMMTGLYCDSDKNAIETAEKIISIKPDSVRIYPTIVLKNTDLGDLYIKQKYKPQSFDDAVNLSSLLLKMFIDADIKVIRLGLHTIEKDSYIAGPWHPAFSELCYSKLYCNLAISLLKEKGDYIIFVNRSSISKMIGQNRSNILSLKEKGYNCRVKENNKLKDFEIIAERTDK